MYNIENVNGNEVFRLKNYRKRIADDILKSKTKYNSIFIPPFY